MLCCVVSTPTERKLDIINVKLTSLRKFKAEPELDLNDMKYEISQFYENNKKETIDPGANLDEIILRVEDSVHPPLLTCKSNPVLTKPKSRRLTHPSKFSSLLLLLHFLADNATKRVFLH